MHSDHPSPDEDTELLNEPLAADSALLEQGSRLDAYVIRRLLGEGGMGRVYLAEQTHPVRREVALKLVREQVASPMARAYFDVERQALAQMQHPAIAQVLDAGTTANGHPYLAMEVVEGQPLTQFCRDAKLDLDQRLGLFVRICHGVQHAHQKGIIHRDLKPANVLVRDVDGTPMPKIIDFGIAIGGIETGDGTQVDTSTTALAGTALYMSPEQSDRSRRHLDTRSDVYSLGVMLYEVLTGSDAGALTSAAHRSDKGDPHRTLLATIIGDSEVIETTSAPAAMLEAARRLPDELRAILRKSLATERNDRYDSAAALADDLERFRAKQPVKAMAQTRYYLARSFVARHRLGLAATGLILIALAGGIAMALNGLAQAQRSADQAHIEATKANRIADFVRSILSGLDPDRAKSMDTRLMRAVLDSAAERAGRELATEPEVRSAIESTIADSYTWIGEPTVATGHFEAAIAAGKEAKLGAVPMARLLTRRAENATYFEMPKALEAANAALALVEPLPIDNRDRLDIEGILASIENEAGKNEESRARYLRILDVQRRALGDDDPDTLRTMLGLAGVDSSLALYDEARPLYETVLKRYMSLYGDENSKVQGVLTGMSVLELEQKNFAAAEALLAPLLPIVERERGLEHPVTANVLNNLGSAIRLQGRNEEARPLYERVLKINRKLYGPGHLRTLYSETNLALLLRDAGQLDLAEQHARFSADHTESAFGENPYRGAVYRELATILIRQKKYAEAEQELDRAWKIMTAPKAYGPAHTRVQDVVDSYVELYAAWGKPESEASWRAKKTVKPDPTTSDT